MLTSRTLSALPGIRHAFFTRQGGVSEGIYESLNGGIGSRDAPAHVAENRTRMATTLGIQPDALLSAYQIHSPDVVVAEQPWAPDQRPRVDAIVTRVPGLACGISTADCGPVLFADAQAQVVGAAHAGWRGALGGVIESTVAAMEKLGADRARIATAIGPLIRQPNYEVGDEMRAAFVAGVAEHAQFFVPGRRAAHWQFDLPGFIALQLARAGISQIEDLGACTYADAGAYYSYRRSTHRSEPDYGRHISAIALSN
jgi:YfiH family protein